MTKHAHACVWIDHREAKIFSFNADLADETVLHEPRTHLHQNSDNLHLGKAPIDVGFLADIADQLHGFRGIVIVGPGTARTEFAGYLAAHDPQVAKKVWGIEPMDHPTDGQILAAARKYFRAEDRMHG